MCLEQGTVSHRESQSSMAKVHCLWHLGEDSSGLSPGLLRGGVLDEEAWSRFKLPLGACARGLCRGSSTSDAVVSGVTTCDDRETSFAPVFESSCNSPSFDSGRWLQGAWIVWAFQLAHSSLQLDVCRRPLHESRWRAQARRVSSIVHTRSHGNVKEGGYATTNNHTVTVLQVKVMG